MIQGIDYIHVCVRKGVLTRYCANFLIKHIKRK